MAGSHTQDTPPGAPFANTPWPNKNTANPAFQFVLMLRGILRKPENSGDRFQWASAPGPVFDGAAIQSPHPPCLRVAPLQPNFAPRYGLLTGQTNAQAHIGSNRATHPQCLSCVSSRGHMAGVAVLDGVVVQPAQGRCERGP